MATAPADVSTPGFGAVNFRLAPGRFKLQRPVIDPGRKGEGAFAINHPAYDVRDLKPYGMEVGAPGFLWFPLLRRLGLCNSLRPAVRAGDCLHERPLEIGLFVNYFLEFGGALKVELFSFQKRVRRFYISHFGCPGIVFKYLKCIDFFFWHGICW